MVKLYEEGGRGRKDRSVQVGGARFRWTGRRSSRHRQRGHDINRLDTPPQLPLPVLGSAHCTVDEVHTRKLPIMGSTNPQAVLLMYAPANSRSPPSSRVTYTSRVGSSRLCTAVSGTLLSAQKYTIREAVSTEIPIQGVLRRNCYLPAGPVGPFAASRLKR